MDYGQPVQQDNGQPFFTSGAGGEYEHATDSLEKSDNVDLSNEQISWNTPSEHDNRSIGNVAVTHSESGTSYTEKPSMTRENTYEQESSPELGKIITMDMPPGIEVIDTEIGENNTSGQSQAVFNKAEIKTGEKLSKTGIKEVNNLIEKFKQDDNVIDFYNAAREMTEVHLDNSFSRKLGEAA